MPEGPVAALLLAGGAAGLWLLLALTLVRAHRPGHPAAGPRSLDLPGDEPPAVVNLLANRWRLRPEAVPATLLDLAARRHVDIDQLGPGDYQVRPRHGDDDALTPYEAQVLAHVRTLAQGGVVPARALAAGPQDVSARWWRDFHRAVVADAQARGVARDQWGPGTLLLLVVTACLPALPMVVFGVPGPLLTAVAMLWLLTALIEVDGQRDTPAGLAAAARWLGLRDHLGADEVFPTLPPAAVAIWDRHLAYGAALGVAAAAVGALPMGAASDTRAWSAYGGRWRVVRVRYPRTFGSLPDRPAVRAVAPLVPGLLGLVLVLAVGLALAAVARGVDLRWVLGPMAVVAAVVALGAGAAALARRRRSGPPRRFEGQVLRLRARVRVPLRALRGREPEAEVVHYVAVDDGRADEVTAWVVPEAQYAELGEGSIVRVTVGRGGRLADLTELSEPVGGGAPPPLPSSSGPAQTSELSELLDRAGVSGRAADAAWATLPVPWRVVTRRDASRFLTGRVYAHDLGGVMVGVLTGRQLLYSDEHGGQLGVQVAAGRFGERLMRRWARRGRPLPGIGEEAVVAARGATVVVRRDGVTAILSLRGRAARARRAALPALAREVDERLSEGVPTGGAIPPELNAMTAPSPPMRPLDYLGCLVGGLITLAIVGLLLAGLGWLLELTMGG